jgi:hypothetical protein
MEYQTFEVTVDARADGRYEVRSRSPSGESPPTPCPSVGAEELARRRDALVLGIDRSRAARDVVVREPERFVGSRLRTARTTGTALFEMLFTGPVLEAYRTSLALARAQDTGLRLQLRLHPAELAALPWEFLFDPRDKVFVALNPATPVVRYPELAIAPKTLAIQPPLRVLVMMASPIDLERLDVEGERRRIDEALGTLHNTGQVELGWVSGGAYADLQKALRQGPWHVFHFVGHGGFDEGTSEKGGMLALEFREEHTTHRVSAAILGQLLCAHTSLRLVVLNSCLGARGSEADAFSSVAATLVRLGIPAVVAMQYEISDQAALAFAQSFYTAIAAWVPVDRAVADARADMNATREDSLEWGTPVLLMRAADGRLFGTSPPGSLVPPRSGPGVLDVPRIKPTSSVQPTHVWPAPIGPSVKAAAAGLTLPVLLGAGLALIRMPSAEMRLSAEVSGFTVALDTQTNIGEDIKAARLGVSGLDHILFTGGPNGSGGSESDAIHLAAIVDSGGSGQITLDLRNPLPAGTALSLARGDEPGSFVLKLDSLEELDVPVSGPVAVIVPGETNERMDFGASGSISLRSAGRQLRMDFTPASNVRGPPLVVGLASRGLGLSRIEQFVSGDRIIPRRVSTILGGALEVAGGSRYRLEPRQVLWADSARGTMTASLGDGHLILDYTGKVAGLTTGAEGHFRSLVPSVLHWSLVRQPWALLGGLLLYLAILALAVGYRLRRVR